MNKPIYVYDEKLGSVHAGNMEDGILYKKVERKKHFLRNFNSYAVQERVFEEHDPDAVIIYESDQDRILRASRAMWDDYGRTVNFGHGTQRALEERFFNVVK